MTDPDFPADTALVIVDVQNDFCPGGALAVAGGDEILPLVNDLKKRFSTVILTQDWHPAGHKSFAGSHTGKAPFQTMQMPYGNQVLWPEHCVQGTAGADFHKDLEVAETDLVLRKGTNPGIDSYSGFYENDGKTQPRFDSGETLAEVLRARGISRIVFVGLAYDFCVGWHALDARKEGFDAAVIMDGTRSIAIPGVDGGPDTKATMTVRLLQAGVRLADTVAGKKPAAPLPGPAP